MVTVTARGQIFKWWSRKSASMGIFFFFSFKITDARPFVHSQERTFCCTRANLRLTRELRKLTEEYRSSTNNFREYLVKTPLTFHMRQCAPHLCTTPIMVIEKSNERIVSMVVNLKESAC